MSVTIAEDGFIAEAIGIYWPNLTFGAFTSTPKWIVLHGTATANATAVNIADYWASQSANNTGDASTNIIIDKNGSYVQGLSFNEVAWCNSGAPNSPRANYLPSGNLNYVTRCSIEHCKFDTQENSDILTVPQRESSFSIIKAVCEKYNIPKKVLYTSDDVSQGGIIDHKSCDGLYREFCPGPYPWNDLKVYLNGGPSMFTDEGCIQVWESNFRFYGKPIPQRDTGIFNYWRTEWRDKGNFLGPPVSAEYPYQKGVAQNFSKIIAWNNGSASIV